MTNPLPGVPLDLRRDRGQMTDPIAEHIRSLRGPIVVLGAAGFVGANLYHRLAAARSDVFAVIRQYPTWRLADVPSSQILEIDIADPSAQRHLIQTIKPTTLFDCVAYGAYSFETNQELIYRTNFQALTSLFRLLSDQPFSAFVHAGSSSEYGTDCSAPEETAFLAPNSHYAVSKAAGAHLVHYYGKILGAPCVNLRLYSIYGPLEDTSRLIPNLVRHGLERRFPPLVNPDISRDFVYIGDAVESFIIAASKMNPSIYGESFNIASGQRTTIRHLAGIAKQVYGIADEPTFASMPARPWDLNDWYGNPTRAREVLGWSAKTSLTEGLERTTKWMKALPREAISDYSKHAVERKRSVSAIIACYRDGPSIPIMHERLSAVFRKLGVEYEIIFVNDGSPDDAASRILEISARDPHVLGVTHSRNFGSQMAFRSGMEVATKHAVVLLDGDLQDPPELIGAFYEKYNEGFDVVYGRRVRREMPFLWGMLYKAFYRVFAAFSYIQIPLDAGDFSLMDRRVVAWLLTCTERDVFIRGLRAYVGFRQAGVDYVRPERMFGRTTNSFWKNIEWAKRGIFSFSNTPLTMLTTAGVGLLGVSFAFSLVAIGIRIFSPTHTPPGITTLLLAICGFGALNLFAIALVGEYIAKIMTEVKGRPRLIRSELIRNGETSKLTPTGN